MPMKLTSRMSILQFLLLAILLLCNGQAARQVLQAPCSVTQMDIQTESQVNSFQEILSRQPTGCNMTIKIETSNLDLFPGDVFQPYNVFELQLLDSNMSNLPYNLIKPICKDKLQHLVIINNYALTNPFLFMDSRGFEGCTALQEIWLENVIQNVHSEAFQGLDNLQKLTLQGNQIQRVDIGLEGLQDKVWYLNLGVNPITSVPNDTFLGWTKLTFLALDNAEISTLDNGTFSSLGPNPSVILSGNPLNCYDLQWLQDWYNENPIDTDEYHDLGFTGDPWPMCSVPCNVPLLSVDYEHDINTCGAQQITSLGLLALLLIAISTYQI